LNKFRIAETDTFASKVNDSKYNKIYKKILDYVYPQLRENPFFGSNIKKLKGEFEGIYRYRVGKYRIFYKIEDDTILVIILDIDYRKDAYGHL
jgi:mRNA interferase RelE/StbE